MRKRLISPSAHDVAKLAGVSQAAVSRAFTPGASVSATTRERVFEAARKIGYRPNLVARSLITGRSGIIGIVIGNPKNPSCIAALQALSAKLSLAGKHILIFVAEKADSPVDVHVEELLQFKVDALVLMSANLSPKLADECHSAGIPVISCIRVGQSYEGMVSVTGDNRGGAQKIAEHLFEQGYRKPAYLAAFRTSPTSHEREAVFSDHVTRLGLPAPEVIQGHFERDRAMAAVRATLARPDRPDAIYCANDYLAIATIELARYEFGLEIGRELGVAGFDDIDQASWPSFDLTTYSQPTDEMMEQVVGLLLQESSAAAVQVVVPGALIPRKSTQRA